MKKLIPAIVMLLVSAVVLSTASYAWFTTSASVTADGMKVTAQAPTSILISGQDATGALADGWTEFTSFVEFPVADNKISAASSVTGVNSTFYAPTQCDDIHGSIHEDSDIEAVSNGTVNYYVDYVIKLQNTSADSAVDIYLESISISNTNIKNAVRVAILDGTGAVSKGVFYPADKDVTTATVTYVAGASGALSKEFDQENPGTDTLAGVAAGSTTAIAVWGNTTEAANTVVAHLDAYDAELGVDDPGFNGHQTTLTIRIWFEGQDAACITENAGLASELGFQFGIVD